MALTAALLVGALLLASPAAAGGAEEPQNQGDNAGGWAWAPMMGRNGAGGRSSGASASAPPPSPSDCSQAQASAAASTALLRPPPFSSHFQDSLTSMTLLPFLPPLLACPQDLVQQSDVGGTVADAVHKSFVECSLQPCRPEASGVAPVREPAVAQR